MKWHARFKHPQGWVFEISHKPAAGYYLWVYKNGETMDYLQDTLEIAKKQAFGHFGVPLDSWVEGPEKGF